MKLSVRDRDILFELQSDSNKTAQQIAKSLRIKTHTVHRAISRFREAKIMSPAVMIDSFKLGYERYKLYLSMGLSSKKQKNDFKRVVDSSLSVSHSYAATGSFTHVLALQCRTASELHEFLSVLRETVGRSIVKKSVVLVSSETAFSYGVLSSKCKAKSEFSSKIGEKEEQIDELDAQILEALSNQLDMTSDKEFSEQLEVPHSTFRYRLSQLERKKIILGHSMWVYRDAIGAEFYHYFLSLADEDPRVRDKLFQFARKHPNVATFTEVVGPWDIELSVLADSDRLPKLFLDELYDTFQSSIREIDTFRYAWVEKARAFSA